ncbi:MAG: ATP-dependent sacrificial sulfur transferase LarE [Candidatus Heimdallarchaeota archaeon]
MNKKNKITELDLILAEMKEVVIAFSGGVDSTFLAQVAFNVLDDKAIAITLDTPQFPSHELEEAKLLAKEIGIKHLIIDTSKMDYSWFEDNPPDRCYICKKGAIERIQQYCKTHQISGQLIEGSNFDDLDDYRPGYQAVKEYSVKSPLIDAQLTKEEIRLFSKQLGLSSWDKPSSPCLATRFFFGEKITKEKLAMVYKAEEFLKELGILQLRVRVHGLLARVEVSPVDFPLLVENAEKIASKFKEIGFDYATLDLNGYKRGSMNKTQK